MRILTGVGFDDKDGDRSYDVGEGLGGIAVKAVSASGAVHTTRTMSAGGYQLDLPAGTYTVTFSGGGVVATTRKVVVGTTNVKLDLVDPILSGAAAQAVAATVVNGTEAGERIVGSRHADILKGFGGSDTLLGLGGRDKLHGNAGNDILSGGAGSDVLTGGAGRDAFVFGTRPDVNAPDTIRDFSARDDTNRLHIKAFSSLAHAGRLSADAFYKGVAADDADDRIVYDETSGALFYDADGSGAGAAVQFAQLRYHRAITQLVTPSSDGSRASRCVGGREHPGDVLLRQDAVQARREIVRQREGADLVAMQCPSRGCPGREHPPYLMVAALGQGHRRAQG